MLQAIDIDAYDILNQTLFMDMVQSRSRITSDSSFAISRLKRVAISFRYADGQLERVLFARARVRQLREEGLDISIVQHFEGGSSFTL
jgi:DNA-binding transcriptional LysR family regulator